MAKAKAWPPRYLTESKSRRSKGPQVCEFVEEFCKLTKTTIAGRAGDPLELRAWQTKLLFELFKLNAAGRYQYQTALIGLPRKQGKSSLGAAIALRELLIGEDGGEVYSCAGDKKQAAIVFNAAKKMVELDTRLRSKIKIYRDALEVPQTGSSYRVLSADAFSAEGLNPNLVIFDELHVQKDRELWETMNLGSGARIDPMTIAITTAGVRGDRHGNDTVCYELYQYGQKVVSGETEDPSFFFAWWEPKDGPEANYRDPKVWEEANPGYADLVSVANLESNIKKISETGFRTKRLNQWVSNKEAALPQGAWEACADEKRIISSTEPVVFGFDGAWSGDSTALIIQTVENPHVDVLQVWEKDPNDENWRITIEDVKEKIRQSFKEYNCWHIVMDPAYWEQVLQDLDEERYPIVRYPNNPTRMIPAWKKSRDAVLDKAMTHSNNPILNRHVSNMILKQDNRGERPTKETSTSPRKIDAAIAWIMAHDIASGAEPPRKIMDSIR